MRVSYTENIDDTTFLIIEVNVTKCKTLRSFEKEMYEGLGIDKGELNMHWVQDYLYDEIEKGNGVKIIFKNTKKLKDRTIYEQCLDWVKSWEENIYNIYGSEKLLVLEL